MSMTLRRNPTPENASTDGQPPEAETKMRRALGLLPSTAPRGRSRTSDGPVVEHRGDRQPGSSVNRIAVAEAALNEERLVREQLARQLREAEAALREAQTKWGHAELARDEAIAALAVEREARDAAEAQIKERTAAPKAPEIADTEPTVDQAVAQEQRRTSGSVSEPATRSRRRGRPPGSGSKLVRSAVPDAPDENTDDTKAVEWWVPGWQERI